MAKEINNEENIANNNVENNELDEKLKMLDEKSKELDEKLKMLDEKSKELDEKSKELGEKSDSYKKIIAEAEAKIPKVSDIELIESAKKVGEELKKMDKVKVRIPIDERNPGDKFVPVTISGYTFQIERGQSVEVPEEVSRILIEAKYI